MNNQAAITNQIEQNVVRCTVHEVWYSRMNDNTRTVSGFTSEPTDEQAIAWGIETGQCYPLSTFDETQVIEKVNEQNGFWHATIRQWDWLEQERDVSMIVPVSDLPQNYTDADVIAWGRDHGVLAPAEA